MAWQAWHSCVLISNTHDSPQLMLWRPQNRIRRHRVQLVVILVFIHDLGGIRNFAQVTRGKEPQGRQTQPATKYPKSLLIALEPRIICLPPWYLNRVYELHLSKNPCNRSSRSEKHFHESIHTYIRAIIEILSPPVTRTHHSKGSLKVTYYIWLSCSPLPIINLSYGRLDRYLYWVFPEESLQSTQHNTRIRSEENISEAGT